jgi:hypothetical protein
LGNFFWSDTFTNPGVGASDTTRLVGAFDPPGHTVFASIALTQVRVPDGGGVTVEIRDIQRYDDDGEVVPQELAGNPKPCSAFIRNCRSVEYALITEGAGTSGTAVISVATWEPGT